MKEAKCQNISADNHILTFKWASDHKLRMTKHNYMLFKLS